MIRKPLDARHAMRANSASRSAKNSRSPEGSVGAKAAGASEPRTRAASTRSVVPEASLGIVLSESSMDMSPGTLPHSRGRTQSEATGGKIRPGWPQAVARRGLSSTRWSARYFSASRPSPRRRDDDPRRGSLLGGGPARAFDSRHVLGDHQVEELIHVRDGQVRA